MQFFDIKPSSGWRSVFASTRGSVISAGCFFLIILNIFFSAVGLYEIIMGQRIRQPGAAWIDFSFIQTGGPVFWVGIIIGVIASFVQAQFWSTDSSNGKEGAKITNIQFWLIVLLTIYDAASTIACLMSISYNPADDVLSQLTKLITIVPLSIAIFSVGSEIFFDYGIETFAVNYPEARKTVAQWINNNGVSFSDIVATAKAPAGSRKPQGGGNPQRQAPSIPQVIRGADDEYEEEETPPIRTGGGGQRRG